MPSPDDIRRIKIALKERSSVEYSDEDIGREIAEYFRPNTPPPNLSEQQMSDIVESLLGDESN